MKNVIEIEDTSFIYGLKPLAHGVGGYAECYMYDNNNILKFYYNDMLNGFDKITLKNLSPLVGIENETYIYPHTLLTKNNELIGYIMKYIPKDNLYIKRGNINIELLINALSKLEEDTKIMAKKHIITGDVKSSNILFDKEYTIIDPDFFVIDKNVSEKECLRINMENIVETIRNYFLGVGMHPNSDFIRNFIIYNPKLCNLYIDTKLHKDSIEILKLFLFTFIEEVENNTGLAFKTVKQMQNAIVRKR